MAMIMDRGLINAELLRLRNEYREYREKHWDTERNHIRPEFAEGLYRIFRDGIIMRKVVGDSYVREIVDSGHSLCPIRHRNRSNGLQEVCKKFNGV